jgi:putative FmdB family regulatory protein
MPFYEYYCPVCSQHFQIEMAIAEYSQGAIPKCPACGSTEARRILSAPQIRSSSQDPDVQRGGCWPGGCCG